MESITVVPGTVWNKVPKNLSPFPGASTWTVDGVNLNGLSFFSDVEDGNSIFKAPKTVRLPVYRSNMLPTEVAELAETTFSKFLNLRVIASGETNPVSMAGLGGFEYTFEMVGGNGPISKFYVVAVTEADKLQMVLYHAVKLHYFDQYIGEVKKLVATASISK